jgi:diguanylate cyclase (GGDEF)-like protein/PAS domain S-box-containing protein
MASSDENPPLDRCSSEEKTAANGHLSIEVSESILADLKQQKNWHQLVIDAITEKLTQLKNENQFPQMGEHFRLIAEATPIPVIIASVTDGKICYANPITSTILNLSQQELLNYSLKDFFESPDQEEQLVATTLQEGLIQNREFRWRKPDGQIIWVSVSAQPFYYQEQSTILSACCDITACKELEQALAEKEAFLQLILDNIPQLIFWKDTNFNFMGGNRLWAKAAGFDNMEEVIGKSDQEIYDLSNNRHKYPPKEYLNYYREQDQRVLITGQPELHYVDHKQDPDGQEVWYDTNKIPIKNNQGQIVGILGTIENITLRKLAERALFQEKELAQVTLKSIGEGVICINNLGKIENINPVGETLTGWNNTEAKGLFLSEVFHLIDEKSREPQENLIKQVLKQNKIVRWHNSVLLIGANNQEYAVDITASPIYNREQGLIGIVVVFSDQTQSRKLSQKLSWQASHDSLTKLVNREIFEQSLQQAVYSAKQDNLEHTLCYLDLDQFKVINDTCGHIAGDDLLSQLSNLLKQRIRSTDTLARLGGDEFGLLLHNCPLEESEKIVEILRKLIEDFRFFWNQQTFKIGVSIGLVIINSESANVEHLLSLADSACYAAKNKGRNCIYIYRKNDEELTKQRIERYWISRINQALDENRFCLYMQKIVPIAPHFTVDHHELLLRLLDEQNNLIFPNEFLPAAERYNLVHKIDRWVLEHFFKNYELHLQKYSQPKNRNYLKVYNINLSALSLNDEGLIQFIKSQLNNPYIFPETICFEITETAAISNLGQTQQLIQSLKKLGCRFALDDFGTGMSSLAYLKYLPVDYLKIDGNFVQNLTHDSINYALVECFNRMGHVLGMHTVAEYVENDLILTYLQAIGIDYVQGYGIARPIPFLL